MTLTPETYLSGRLGDAQGDVFALIYACVSHEESALSDLSIPQQVEACESECERQGWQVLGVFQDAGWGAYVDSDQRPGFQDLIQTATASQSTSQPVSRIVVDKMDRFSRDEHINLT